MSGDSRIKARRTALTQTGGIETVKQAVRVHSLGLVPCRIVLTIRPVFRECDLDIELNEHLRSTSILELPIESAQRSESLHGITRDLSY
jgi:hypothetical protein